MLRDSRERQRVRAAVRARRATWVREGRRPKAVCRARRCERHRVTDREVRVALARRPAPGGRALPPPAPRCRLRWRRGAWRSETAASIGHIASPPQMFIMINTLLTRHAAHGSRYYSSRRHDNTGETKADAPTYPSHVIVPSAATRVPASRHNTLTYCEIAHPQSMVPLHSSRISATLATYHPPWW